MLRAKAIELGADVRRSTKLESLEQDEAGSAPMLLDSYDAERRPIAWRRRGQILAWQDYASEATEAEKRVAIVDDDAMELGQLYRSHVLPDVGPEPPPALRPDRWKGQPGTRAPHVRVVQGGEEMSTLDLFHASWVLVTGDERWRAAVDAARERAGVDVRVAVVRGAEAAGAVATAFGVGPSGGALVRPDGVVAWRREAWSPDAGDLVEALRVAACAAGAVRAPSS